MNEALSHLSDLSPGQRGCVTAIDGGLDIRRRLREMGLTVGVEVELVRRAPLGDPIDIRLRGYHMSLRKSEAACVQLAPPAGRIGANGTSLPAETATKAMTP